MNFKYEVVINRSRDDVWKFFDNPDNMKKWQPTLKKFEPQSGTPGQVGAVSKLTYDENGREIVLIETISSRNEPDEFSGTYSNSMANNSIKNQFIAVDANRTKWVMDCEFKFHGFWKLLGPLMKSAIKKRTTQDVNRFKQMAEGEQMMLNVH
jgi:carbon monoxide dehydrogenase subunit G